MRALVGAGVGPLRQDFKQALLDAGAVRYKRRLLHSR